MKSITYTHAGKEFRLGVISENNVPVRFSIIDDELEFTFAINESKKLAGFISEEYGGDLEAIHADITAQGFFDGIDTTAATKVVKGSKKSKGASGKKVGTDKVGVEKVVKLKKEKVEKVPKEVVTQEFELAGNVVSKKLQIKTVLPGQQPESFEDLMLDQIFKLHIDIFSKKNRTSRLENTVTGEVIIENVSLMDVIYAYASQTGMSFGQADKYIKVKRGLLPDPSVAKAEKAAKKVLVTDKKDKVDASSEG